MDGLSPKRGRTARRAAAATVSVLTLPPSAGFSSHRPASTHLTTANLADMPVTPSRRSASAAALASAPLLGAIALAAVLNTWALGQNGYANVYYSAGVKSMLLSWHNFFFLAADPAGLISIDKPPLGLWLQALSAKAFGFSR